MQKWIAVGNLTKDTELRRTQAGQAVTNFTIAITRARKRLYISASDKEIYFGKERKSNPSIIFDELLQN